MQMSKILGEKVYWCEGAINSIHT